jgi:hypothetical protein
MRSTLLAAALVLALVASGCAVFNGNLSPLKLDPEVEITKPVQHTGASIYVERPEIVDRDEEKDFTPIAETYAASMQQRVAEYLCARRAFDTCSDQPVDGAFRLVSKVIVEDFRIAHGGIGLGILGSLLLPPALGMAWAFPVSSGTCKYHAQMEILAPDGMSLFSGKAILGEGFGRCRMESEASYYFRKGLDDVAPQLASAAVVAAAHVKVQGSRKREILAVFDIQDVSARFDGQTLGQLTAYLAASMTNSGPFDVVPHEQLRERLTDEKKSSYRPCFDTACQIELGRALAAQKTLATQLIQVSEKCAVVSSLYDLKSETAKAAATVETGCGAGELLGALKQVADQIAAQVK